MDTLDRYLQSVSAWLPKGQRADIVAELREDLRSEIDEREGRLGRPLAPEELDVLLERRGHPMWVAEAYLQARHLIGPAMLPVYWRVLQVAGAVLVAVFAVLGAVFSGPAKGVLPAFASPGAWVWLFCVAALAYVGLFTIIFGLIERRHRRAQATGRWNPRDPDGLPEAPAKADARARLGRRVGAVVDAASDLLLLAFWLGLHQAVAPPGAIVVTPAWRALHWPVALFLAASAGVGLANAVRPSWSRGRLVARLAVDAFALILAGVALSAWPWVDITLPAVPAATAATVERWLNLGGLSVLLAATAVYTARVVQLERRISGREPIRHGAMKLVADDLEAHEPRQNRTDALT